MVYYPMYLPPTIHPPIYLINYLHAYYPPTYYLRTNLFIYTFSPTHVFHFHTTYLFTYPPTYILFTYLPTIYILNFKHYV
jgi:hypothetical protein